jgi:hypothetical protein
MDPEHKSIFESIQTLRDAYTNILLKALKEVLPKIKQATESGKYIGKYYNFPNLFFNKNGLPSLSSTIGDGPIEYRSCFRSFNNSPLMNENDVCSFNELVDFVRNSNTLSKRFSSSFDPSAAKDLKIEFDRINIISTAQDCIERYIHKFNTFSYDEEFANAAVAPTVSYIFDQQLNIDISIPILFIKFEADEYQLAEGVRIERISDLRHKSRYRVKSYNTSVHEHVTASATHALTLTGWFVPNTERIWDFDALTKARAYPIELINHFFGALRIASSLDTGYAQVYAVAKGWEAHCIANLPYLQGVTVRSYPAYFEDYYWNTEDIPVISERTIGDVTEIFNKIISAKENSINLALKRLNRCLVRDDEEDSVLDATIALEALLSDDGNQEMTHKLAMRVGALVKLEKGTLKSPGQAFREIKSIYGYRSAIVHGSKDLNKKRIVKIEEDKNTTAHSLAIEYLKIVLRILLEHERFRNPKAIDEELLLG